MFNKILKSLDQDRKDMIQQGERWCSESVASAVVLFMMQGFMQQDHEMYPVVSVLCVQDALIHDLKARVETLEAELENIRRKL
jgi:hypothetical protein